jgi:hypothetical protein
VPRRVAQSKGSTSLAAEAVERAALALERVHDVERRDGLAARVLRVRDAVADDVLEEDLEDAAGLLVDEARDALHAATASQAADRRLLRLVKGRGQGGWIVRRSSILPRFHPLALKHPATLTVMPWMLSRRTLRWRFAPPLPATTKTYDPLSVSERGHNHTPKTEAAALTETLAALATSRHFTVVYRR